MEKDVKKLEKDAIQAAREYENCELVLQYIPLLLAIICKLKILLVGTIFNGEKWRKASIEILAWYEWCFGLQIFGTAFMSCSPCGPCCIVDCFVRHVAQYINAVIYLDFF